MQRRGRSVSEPALRLRCGSVSRERRRESEVEYETGRDRAALSISQWSPDQVCVVLYCLLCRCSQPQLKTLCTSLECVPHRDLQLSSVGVESGLELRPISTPLSREVRVRLRKSRRPQNRRLYRAHSTVIHDELPLRPSPLPTPPPPPSHHRQSPHLDCPSLNSPSSPLNHLSSSPPTMTSLGSRSLTTPRRHMLTTPSPVDLLTSGYRPGSRRRMTSDLRRLPEDATQFLTWFSGLSTGWQQQEILHMVVANLDPCELYLLSALLMSRLFRDPVSCLPEALALHILRLVPAKDLLRHCSRVSRVWHERCTSERLWKQLCSHTRLGVPMPGRCASWRRLFIDSLRMRHNWWRGLCEVKTLRGHRGRVLCVKLRGSVVATGSSDSTIRIWSLESGHCLQVLTGHSKGVWCLCFYGKRLLISGSSDHSIKVWNIETRVCERTAEVHCGVVWCLQQKEEVLLTGSHDRTAVLWDARCLKPSHRLEGHGGVVMAADLTDSATTAFTGAGDGVVRVWDVCSGECVRSVGVRGDPPVTSLSWCKGWLAWSGGCVVSVWDTVSWKSACNLTGHEDRIECVQLKVHDGSSGRGLVITTSRDATVRYWTSHTGRMVHTLRGHTATVNSASSNPRLIASASDDTTLRLWDFHSYHMHR